MFRPDHLLGLLVWLLPACSAKNWVLRLLGHTVASTAWLAPNLVLGGGRFVIGEDCAIGPGNVFRNLARVEMAHGNYIGRFNQFTAAPAYQRFSDRAGTLVLEEQAAITNRHYFDVSGAIILERFSGVGGIDSIFQSHEIDIVTNATTVGTIVVGERAMTATRCVLLKNARVPGWSVLAAGSVVTAARGTPGQDSAAERPGLYAGVPATWRRELPHCEWWYRDSYFTPVREAGDL